MSSKIQAQDIKQVAMWNGEPVENLPHSKLVEIIEELIEQRDRDRELEHRRMSLLFPIPSQITEETKNGSD